MDSDKDFRIELTECHVRERRGSTRNVEYQPARRTSLDQFPLVNPIDLRLLEVEGDSCSIE
jgi:hypothetical protein